MKSILSNLLLGIAFGGLTSTSVAVGKTVQYSLRFDGMAVTYALPQPRSFHSAPIAFLPLEKGASALIFSAFYERTMLPDKPLYEVAAALVRTQGSVGSLESGEFLRTYGNEAALKLALHDPEVQTRNLEIVGENAWMVITTYTDRSKTTLRSVLYTRPVGDERVLTFRLNFWESNKNPEWKRKRLPLLRGIVQSVRISET